MVAVSRMLFSISIGEEDRRSLIDTMTIALTRGMLLMGVIVVLLVVSAEPLTRLFYRDPSDPVYQMTVMGFRLLPLCMPPAVISLQYACYAQTAQKKTMSVVLPVIDGVVGVCPFQFHSDTLNENERVISCQHSERRALFIRHRSRCMACTETPSAESGRYHGNSGELRCLGR